VADARAAAGAAGAGDATVTIADLLGVLRSDGLLSAAPPLPADVAAAPATGIVHDSRQAAPGVVFVAVHGQHADGNAFTPQAVSRGAAVVISEDAAPGGVRAPWVQVPDARLALALLADRFFGHPSGDLSVIGITGTNGKTTTAYLLRAAFEGAGHRCGLMGTVAYSLGDEEREATRTTPEAPAMQAMLREMADRGCRAAVMEVSSHALALRRVDGTRFAAAVFTNLTRDHLDFHRDMEAYAAAKRRLFEMLPEGAPGIVNADDPRGAMFIEAARLPVTYGVRRPADVSPGPLALTLNGLRFEVRTPAGAVQIASPLVGRPNAYNVLAAVATGIALGLPPHAIETGIASLVGVPGRFEVVSEAEDGVTVVVDYAHTDDALKNLLETVRGLAPSGRVITVFGCGGDRDRTKRPLMGAVAGRMSDIVIVTSDNPRSENPAAIIDEVMRGMPQPSERTVQSGTERRLVRGPDALSIVDRRAAIERAIDLAEAGDLVILAGKGHEKVQVIGERSYRFDDVEVAREALVRRRSRQRVG
jgi:UDP-N-acetylmuramoyl-L-alanyl-D-glutamate--2,6-diaminopimelate ligase